MKSSPFDDTDHEKTGRRIEKIGRVHSQLAHKAVLGFKCLCMAVTDGVSTPVWIFSRLGKYIPADGVRKSYSRIARPIWGSANAIAEAFGLLAEEIYDVVINQSEKIAHICEFYNLKSAS